MSRPGVRHLILLGALLLSALLIWFAYINCRSAVPVTRGYLRGIALSLGQAIETIASRDPSLKLLADFRSPDIAYFCIVDRRGTILFHTNPDLVGERLEDRRYQALLGAPTVTEGRIRLGTGEVVYEFQQQLHIAGGPLILRLALHTWQADRILRRTRAGGAMMMLLLVAAWGFGLWSLRLQRRDLRRREELARREHLARLGELGAVLAHEVRTPLAGIKGYAQLLAERPVGDRERRYAQRIVAESERLEELVNDLLTYAVQESAAIGTAELAGLVRGAWEDLSAAAPPGSPHFVLQLSGELEREVACVPARLRQVLLNLLGNARQAMPSGGTVQVLLDTVQDRARVVIRDDGSGFSPEGLTRAFDPFYTTRARGSGLGLAICRKVVESCGGTIRLENGGNGGAEITLELPLSQEGRR